MKVFESLFLFFTFIFVSMFAHPELTYEFSTPKYFFLIIFMTVLISVYLIRNSRKKNLKLYFSAAHLGWMLFGISALISTLTVLRTNPIYFSFSFEIGIYTMFTFFIVTYLSNTLDTKKAVNYFLLAVLVSGFMVSIEALTNFYTGNSFFLGSYGAGGKMSMKATIGNPNFVSDFLASLMPITIYFALSKDFSWILSKNDKNLSIKATVLAVKAIAVLNFSLYFFVVLLAGTRAVFLSLAVGVVVFILGYIYYIKFSKKDNKDKIVESAKDKEFNKSVGLINKITLIVTLSIGVLLPLILSNPDNPLAKGINVSARTASIFDERGFQTTGGKARVLAWKASENQWKENPIIGSGIGTYMLYAVDHMADVMHESPEYIDSWSNFKRTHNDYFQVLGEMGIFGISAVVFTLIAMLIMFFRMLKNIDNKDDALLLILLAVSFTEILGHSFTEFPLHLLPNQLWAMAIGGIGFGSYLNRKNILAKRINMKFSIIMVILAVSIIIGITSGVFKYKSMMAEAEFKAGNGYYSGLSQIEVAVNQLNQQRSQVEAAYTALDNREGIYQKYKEEIFLPTRIQELKSSGISGISESQLQLKASNDLQTQLQAEYAKLQNYLNQIDAKLSEAKTQNSEYFGMAMDKFLSSVNNSNCYGKSLFYLSLMMARPERKVFLVNEFINSGYDLSVLGKQFGDIEEETRFILPEFRNYPMKEDLGLYKIISDKFGSDYASRVMQISLWYDIKLHQDGIDYFKTSLKCFNEKNTYRIMGKFYFNLSMLLNNIVDSYIALKNDNSVELDPATLTLIDQLISNHRIQSAQAMLDFSESYNLAIYILPGNWQMFPDWEKIYAEYIDLTLKSDSVLNLYPKIKEISEKRIWACESMHNVERLGVPDDIVSVYSQIAQAFLNEKYYQETLTVLDDGLSMLENAYIWNKNDLQQNTYLSESELSRIRSFLNSYDSMKDKRVQFINQMISVYRNSLNDENLKKSFEEDWKTNYLTGQKNDAVDLQEIISKLEETMK